MTAKEATPIAPELTEEAILKSAPMKEKKVNGKCPWCEDRKSKIDAEIKSVQAMYDDDQLRVKQARIDLDAQGRSTAALVNMYALDLKELLAEKSRIQGYQLINTGHKVQCGACGKNWEVSALGKPYSLELERGTSWLAEQERKRLLGSH